MESTRFIAYTERLTAYQGAVLARYMREENSPMQHTASHQDSRSLPISSDAVEVTATRAGMFGSPLADIVSWGAS